MIERGWLVERGFSGFVSIADLRASGLQPIPDHPGVYAVLRESATDPVFMPRNPGGRFKGKDPTVDISILSARWNSTCHPIYLGKAGTERGKATLKGRLRAYLDFGAGKPVGHWGGRLTWQLAKTDELVIAWRLTRPEGARALEKSLLAEFAAHAGKLPFANLRR